MERYLRYLVGIAAARSDDPSQPVYGISGSAELIERSRHRRCRATAAWDRCASATTRGARSSTTCYGAAVLAATQLFFDQRLDAPATTQPFERLEPLGDAPSPTARPARRRAVGVARRARVHTFSSVMCWAACDRLARIAVQLGSTTARGTGRAQAGAHPRVRSTSAAGTPQLGTSVDAFDGDGPRREPAAAGRAQLRRAPTTRAIAPPSGAIERDLTRGDLPVPLHRARRLRRARERVPRLLASGWSTRSRRSAGATRRASCSSTCWPAATARPAGRGRAPRDRRDCGAISRRPTAWSD